MKKLISLLLAFAMVFSLAMPAMAAETTRTIYFENTGNWSAVSAYAYDDSYTEYLTSWPGSAMTKVVGETNIYSIEVSTAATNVIFNDNGGTQSAELTIPTDGNDLYSFGTQTWSKFAKKTGDVTASYTPVIAISGVTISENTSFPGAVAVDETNQTYTITIPADQTAVAVNINVSGQNLDKIPLDSNNYRVMLDPQELNAFAITNGNPNTGNAVLPISINEDYIGTADLKYSTDGGTNWTDTGWNVVVQQAEPTTAEAKWGASKDSLTSSGTLAEAIAAATASGSTVKYIQLQSDVTAESTFVITAGEFTIDLNGHTVTYNDGYTFSLQKSGTKVTFADSGTTGAVTSGSAAAIDLYNGAEVLITGGSYSGEYALMADSGTSAAITGGTFAGAEGFAINNSGTLTISGGTIHSSSLANIAVSGTTTITGGTFTGSGTMGNFAYWSGTLDLSGYSSVTGLKVSNRTGSNLAVSDTTIKLPAGYTFVDGSSNAVTTLASGTVYAIAAVSGGEDTTYTVTVTATENGTVSADKETAAEGDTVTLTVTPAEGYELNTLTVTDADGTPVTVENNQFTMPAKAVTVAATFRVETQKYKITIYAPDTGAETGAVTANVATAAEGATVRLTATPAEGYVLRSVSVNYYVSIENGTTTKPVTVNDDLSFTMPAADVNVWSYFDPIPTEPKITSLYIRVDGAKYNSSNTSAENPVTIYNDSTYEVLVFGTDFNKLDAYTTSVNPSIEFANESTAFLLDGQAWSINYNANFAIYTIPSMESMKNTSDTFEIGYANIEDATNGTDQRNYRGSGVYIVYVDSKKPVYYDVTVDGTTNGTVTAPATAAVGDTVTLTVQPATGYELDDLTVTYGDDDTAVTVTNNTFIMPAGDVTVSATFKKISYTITVNTAENGTVSADKETAAEGATITLTVAPNDGYQIGTVTVKDAEGNTVAFTETGVASGTYTFTMPASNVTVEATFTAIEKTSADISWGSLAYTYTDEAGAWFAGTAEGAGTVTVTNTGTTAITATPKYEATTTEYGTITGSFDVTSADLDEGESQTFKLSLDGTPTKAIPAGTKIGTVTVTIEEYNPVYLNISFETTVKDSGYKIGHSAHTVRFYDANGGLMSETASSTSATETVAIPGGAVTFALYYKPYDHAQGELPIDRDWQTTAKTAVPAVDSNVSITFTYYHTTTVTVTEAQ